MLDKPLSDDETGAPLGAVGEPSSKVSAASWYALGVLTFINIFGYMDRIALSILMEPIKHDLHLSDQQLGLLSGIAFALFYAILGVPLARLADRSSRVRLISICLLLWSSMTALSGFAQNYVQLFLARIGVGVGEAGCVPPAHSLIGDYFPRAKRALGISLFNAGAAVGVSVGMFAIGAIGQSMGWRAAMQIVGVMGLPLAVLTFLTLREPARPELAKADTQSALQSIGGLLRRRALVHLSIGFSLGQVATHGFSQWAPTFLIRSFNMGMAEIGAWIGAISAGGGILGVIVGGLLAARLIPRDTRWELWLPGGALAVCIPLFVAMVLSPYAWLVLLMKMLIGFFGAISSGVAIASVQSFAEPTQRATAVSLVLFLSALLGGGAGPYLIGLASDMLEPTFGKESLRYAFLIAGAMLAWAAVHYWLAARNSLKDRVN
jgi:predicted MFS family arabinose efflux permease